MASTPSRPCDNADRIAGAGHRLRCSRAEGPDLRGSRRAVVGGACRAVDDENPSDAPVDLTGLSAAAASLMEEGRTAAGKASKAQHFVRTYPYNGQLYELQLRSADHVDRHTREGRSFGPAIRGRFLC